MIFLIAGILVVLVISYVAYPLCLFPRIPAYALTPEYITRTSDAIEQDARDAREQAKKDDEHLLR